jgi:hypothetical protein
MTTTRRRRAAYLLCMDVFGGGAFHGIMHCRRPRWILIAP